MGIDPEEVGRRAVDAHDPLTGVDGEHPLDHAPQHGLLLRPLATDRQPPFDQLATERLDGSGKLRNLRDIGRRQGDLDRPGGYLGGGIRQIFERPRHPADEEPPGQQRSHPPQEGSRDQPSLGEGKPGIGRFCVAGDTDDGRRPPRPHDRTDHRHRPAGVRRIVAPRCRAASVERLGQRPGIEPLPVGARGRALSCGCRHNSLSNRVEDFDERPRGIPGAAREFRDPRPIGGGVVGKNGRQPAGCLDQLLHLHRVGQTGHLYGGEPLAADRHGGHKETPSSEPSPSESGTRHGGECP